jgi:hypothetical protein
MRLLKRRERAELPRAVREIRQRSLGLPRIVEPLSSEETPAYSVLDLGAASRPNLEFFLGRGARVTVADFARNRRSLFCAVPESPFDLVLAWDVLNYLARDELRPFMDELAPYFRPRAMLHAFICTGRDMSAIPARYRIEDAATLICEDAGSLRVPSPRYAEPDLLKRMPGLRVEHRFQLRNGMQEYVFSHRPFSVVAGASTEATTFSMNSENAVPIQRTTTTRSFSQSM